MEVSTATLSAYGIRMSNGRYYVATPSKASQELCMLCGDEILHLSAFLEYAEAPRDIIEQVRNQSASA